MRILLLLSFGAWSWSSVYAQTATPAPTPTQPRPAPAPAQRGAGAAARTGMALTVTDPSGATLPGVHVDISGPSARSGETDAGGQLRFTGLQIGTYRLRFSGEKVIAFEREVVVRAGQTADIDVTLNPAPPPPPPPAPLPPPPAQVAPPAGPVGQPQNLSIVDFLDRELIKNEPRKETLLSCSSNTRSMLVQLNQDQANRLYETAEVTYYVVAGEGAVRMNGRDAAVAAGSFVAIPRGVGHSILRRGRRPLIVVMEVSGEPCEQAK